ncbi:MAG: JAB domain-containing protein, partial [Bacteroidales bacterium]
MTQKAIEYSLKASNKRFNMGDVKTSQDAVKFARKFWSDDINIYESSFIILLNSAQNIIGYAKISQGGVCSTVVDCKIVAKYAVESLASSVIFMHNHPTGNLAASTQDKKITSKLNQGLKFLDIKLLDSIIITEDGFSIIDII